MIAVMDNSNTDISLDYKLQLIVKCTARCSVMTIILTQCTYTISAVALIILLGC